MIGKGFTLILIYVVLFANISYAQKKRTASFFFKTDSSELNGQQKDAFSQFASELNVNVISAITIIGYCDDRGSTRYNDSLSLLRAYHLKDQFKNKNLDLSKIKVLLGKGEIALNNQNNIAEQRAANRRVDVEVTYIEKQILKEQPLLADTLKVGDKIILENILFENSRSVLLEESIPVLQKITHIIKEKKQYNIAILGHICCNPPGRDVRDFETGKYNLSQARAKVIYDYLVLKGVDPKRLSYKGMMANFPLGKGEKLDRRVELQITGINNQPK
jgi:outer membrane protein OmpA-like peptidoglycan-associated protein